jgi:MraZ protein
MSLCGEKWVRNDLSDPEKLTVFMGEYRPTLDDKGRVAIPSKIRRAFDGSENESAYVVAPGFDRCVMVFREEDWRRFVEEKLAPHSHADPDHRKKCRFLLGGASVCELDKQGRILVPSNLIEYASLDHDAVIIGVYDRFEIWDARSYDAYRPGGETLESFARDLGL